MRSKENGGRVVEIVVKVGMPTNHIFLSLKYIWKGIKVLFVPDSTYRRQELMWIFVIKKDAPPSTLSILAGRSCTQPPHFMLIDKAHDVLIIKICK